MNYLSPTKKDLYFLLDSIDNTLKDYYYEISILEGARNDLFFYLKEKEKNG